MRGGLGVSLAALAAAAFGAPAMAQETGQGAARGVQTLRQFNIPAGDLGAALRQFGEQADANVLFDPAVVAGRRSSTIHGQMTERQALEALLAGTGLRFQQTASNGYAVQDPSQLGADDRGASAPEAAADEEIVVTGTRIRGVETASPLISFDRDDIDATGSASMSSFSRTIPQQFSGDENEAVGSLNGGSGLNLGRASSFNLRGLGSDSTLVLLNGRRLPPAGYVTYADISMIPLSAVDRIEVVTDGSSALYGSDAVAGVVNIFTRRDFSGAETSARVGTITTGGSDEYRFGQVFGHDWGSGGALLSYEFYHRDNLDASSKDFSAAYPPYNDLLPEQELQTVLLSAHQDVSPNVRFSFDGYYGTREFENHTNGGLRTQAVGRVENLFLAFGGDVDVSDNWLLRTSATYSESETDAVSRFIDFGITSGAIVETDQFTFDSVLDGELFQISGGAVSLALGGHYREEGLHQASNGLSGDRTSSGISAELFVPLFGESNAVPGIHRLELSLSGRFEEYSDVGETANPKVGLLWAPTPDLRVRATYGTSFRAPNLLETSEIDRRVILSSIPDPTSPSGTRLVLFRSGTNADLVPEEATTWSTGFTWLPENVRGLRFDVTYFDVDYTNRISAPPNRNLVLLEEARFASRINRSPTLAEINTLLADPAFLNLFGMPFVPGDVGAVIDVRSLNLASLRVRGLDVGVSHSFDTAFGELSPSLNAAVLFESTESETPGGPEFDRAGTQFAPSDLRLRAALGWRLGSWGANAALNYIDQYENTLVVPPASIDSFTTVDLRLSYEPEIDNGPLSGIQVALSATNLFDEEPPVGDLPAFIAVDSTTGDPTGRLVALEVRKRW